MTGEPSLDALLIEFFYHEYLRISRIIRIETEKHPSFWASDAFEKLNFLEKSYSNALFSDIDI